MIPTLYEPFRHWSEGGSIFILSDLHFDDEDCRLMDPDWISPEEQLAIINKTEAPCFAKRAGANIRIKKNVVIDLDKIEEFLEQNCKAENGGFDDV